jgi:hypothetical protein
MILWWFTPGHIEWNKLEVFLLNVIDFPPTDWGLIVDLYNILEFAFILVFYGDVDTT